MPEGTNVVTLNYPTEAELANLDIYAWDRSNPNAQFKVRIGEGGLAGGDPGSGGGSSTTGVQEWAPNWTGDASWYLPADVAMTIEQGIAKIGTGTIAFAKSTAATPGAFANTTLPVTLEAGAWLRVTASGVVGFCATHLRRV